MICAIHQPQYLPWLGYFEKMASADVFILLDNVQFKKNEWQNRNKIRTSNEQGWQWLTVPVLHDFGQLINQVKINNVVPWRDEHVRAIELNYAKAPFFGMYWPKIKGLYEKEWNSLSDLNVALVRLLADLLGVKTKILLASSLSVASTKTERLVDLCRAVSCNTYIAGSGCVEYMDFNLFKAAGIDVQTQHYDHPVYQQLWAEGASSFLSYMSIIDLVFNCGSRSMDVLRGE